MMKNYIYKILILSFLIIFFDSCTKDDERPEKSVKSYSSKVAQDWFELSRGLIKTTPGFSPPVASRALGYTGIALYQALLPGMPNYASLEGQLSELNAIPTKAEESKIYNWEIVSNACLAMMCRLLYPTATDSLKNILNTLDQSNITSMSIGENQETIDRSIAYGQGVALDIFEWSKTDGGHEGYSKNFPSSYVVPIGPGLWVPTSAQKIPLQPYWGNNRSFVPDDINFSQPVQEVIYSENKQSAFFNQALEVYDAVTGLTSEQEYIAKYWSDDAGLPGTPPGHSISILTSIIALENINLAEAAELYAKVGIGLSDAFVSCWKCKYTFNLIRPVSYIQQFIDPGFKTILSTPPFPEFTSGHSTQSGAFAYIMTSKFGDNFQFTDRTHENRTDFAGAPRVFKSFNAMAKEAAISRLYGGIHFSEAINKGVTQGEKVGQKVNSLKWNN